MKLQNMHYFCLYMTRGKTKLLLDVHASKLVTLIGGRRLLILTWLAQRLSPVPRESNLCFVIVILKFHQSFFIELHGCILYPLDSYIHRGHISFCIYWKFLAYHWMCRLSITFVYEFVYKSNSHEIGWDLILSVIISSFFWLLLFINNWWTFLLGLVVLKIHDC